MTDYNCPTDCQHYDKDVYCKILDSLTVNETIYEIDELPTCPFYMKPPEVKK